MSCSLTILTRADRHLVDGFVAGGAMAADPARFLGRSGAIFLGVVQDFGLLASLALLILLAVARLAGSGLARHGEADFAS
jgi:hypothetical protein